MRRWAGQALAAAGIWALCLTTGCNGFFVDPNSVAGGGTGSSTGDYVYVANATTQSLDAFSVGTNTLTKITSYPLGFTPTAVVVNAQNTMVVVAGLGYIDTLSIGSGGALSQLNGSGGNIVTSDIAAMDISPDGQWLVGVDQTVLTTGAVTLDEYQVSSNGQLTAISSGVSGVPSYLFSGAGTLVPSAVKFAPNGQALYVAGGTAGDVMYTFTTANGTLTQTQALTYAAGSNSGADNALAVSADSAYLFIAHSNGTAGSLLVFSNGLLTPVSSMAAGTDPFSVALNKAGTDVYVANQLSGSISAYGVSAGVLSPLTTSTVVSTTAGLRGLVADNTGNYMLAITNVAPPYLAMFSFNATTPGELDITATGAETAGAVAIAATH